MKNLICLSFITICLMFFSCKKDEKSERFKLLTTPVWTTVSLLADGADASGPGGILEEFKGDAKFKEDGTGYFGEHEGQWWFNTAETEITIKTNELPLPIYADIVELTTKSLKLTTTINLPQDPSQSVNISMTFKAR